MADPLRSVLEQCRAWRKKDLLGIEGLPSGDMLLLLDIASTLKKLASQDQLQEFKPLKNKRVFTLFVEPSTRTKISCTIAARNLGAEVYDISPTMSSLVKGESLQDTLKTVEALGADIVVIRHSTAGVPHTLAKQSGLSIVNAGEGSHEHPTQALLDALTIREAKGKLKGLNIALVGDILHSRVAKSNMMLLATMGSAITLVGPSTLMPQVYTFKISHDLDAILPDSDVIMMLRLQLERQEAGLIPSIQEYKQLFGLNRERLKLLKPDAIIMHPGPMNRGIEIDSEVADSLQSVIFKQVENGIFIRMAVFLALAYRG